MSYVVESVKTLATNLTYVNVYSHMSIEPGAKVSDAFLRFNDGVTNGHDRFKRCSFKLLTGANN